MSIEFNEIYKSFSKEEFKTRLSRLQAEMKKNNLDALLLSTPENIYYLTGYRTWYTSSLFRPVLLFVPAEGDVSISLRVLEKTTVLMTSWVKKENILISGTPTRNLGELNTKDHLDAFNQFITKYDYIQNVGLEAGEGAQYYWSLSLLKEIKESQPNLEFIDGIRTIQNTRMIKSDWEIGKIQNVNYITHRAILDTFAEIIPGSTTELDISKGIAKRMTENGVDKVSYLTVTSGRTRSSTFNAYATDRIINFNDSVLVDISGHIDGYASDLTRCMYIGTEIPEDIYKMAKIANDSVIAGKEFIKPGVKISDLSKTVESVISNSEYKDYLVHSSGHGIGLNVVEHPTIHNSQEEILKEGMVFAVENGVYPYDLNVGAESITASYRSEDIVLVTASGSKWLSGPGKPIYCLSDFHLI